MQAFTFGPFHIDPLGRRLTRDGSLVPLSGRAFDLLLSLVRAQGDIVDKDTLLAAAWHGRIVAENNLTVTMAALRRTLQAGSDVESYILTEHGRGYRFVVPVQATQPRPPHAPPPAYPTQPDAPPLSVLVRPCEALSASPDAIALAAEVTRHLVLRLSRVPGLTVVTEPQSGPRPAVRHILSASVRPAEGGIHAIALLDDTATGATVWADHIQHHHLGLAAMESEVAGRLVRALVIELIDREAAHPPDPSRPAADHQSLRGWSALQRELMFPPDLAEARGHFERALAADPRHPTALAGTAFTIAAEYQCLWNEATRAQLKRADQLATQAVARAPDWPRAWFCRGYVRIWQRRFDAALAAFDRALALDPCDPLPHAYAGHVSFLAGRLEAMAQPIRYAIALSPRDRAAGLWHHWLGLYDFWHRRDDAAIPLFARAADLAPGLIYPPSFLASALAHTGRVAEGRAVLDAWCEAMDVSNFSIQHLREQVFSDHPTYLAGHARLYDGLRLCGVSEA